MLFNIFPFAYVTAFITCIFVPIGIFTLNFVVRKLGTKNGYYTTYSDLLLLLLAIDFAFICDPSDISLMVRRSDFREIFPQILVVFIIACLVIWGWIIFSVEVEVNEAIFDAYKVNNSHQPEKINWPWKLLFVTWFFAGGIMASHLGLFLWP